IRFQAPVPAKDAPPDATIVMPRDQADAATIVARKPAAAPAKPDLAAVSPKPVAVTTGVASKPVAPMPGAEGAGTIVLSPAPLAQAAGKAGAVAPSVIDEAKPPFDLGKYYIAIAAAAVLVIGIGIWLFGPSTTGVTKEVGGGTSPRVETPATPGSILLDIAPCTDIAPWATIDALTQKADGAAAAATACKVTPCVLSLPVGEYHVRASNPNFQGAVEFDVAVEAGQVREVRQAIPGFKAEDEVSKIL